ncbi:hypothetical protein [Mastigocladopsis repens]|uniref:hypothetical protein n=1 Tax=Mastigocladopsis repens TaxID=221287 RepID=UPI001E4B63BE|nr:hypothetical protein [Mastigocladopsis repens]
MKRQTKTYRTALAPWAVVRWFSPTQRIVISRFRSRSDADGHLAVLQRHIPDADLRVIVEMED